MFWQKKHVHNFQWNENNDAECRSCDKVILQEDIVRLLNSGIDNSDKALCPVCQSESNQEKVGEVWHCNNCKSDYDMILPPREVWTVEAYSWFGRETNNYWYADIFDPQDVNVSATKSKHGIFLSFSRSEAINKAASEWLETAKPGSILALRSNKGNIIATRNSEG